jgi:hypothetical protein
MRQYEKVLIFVPSLTLGGAQRQGAMLARHLKRRGFEVVVWSFPSAGGAALATELTNVGIPCHVLQRWLEFRLDFGRRPLRYLRGRFFEWPSTLARYSVVLPSQQFDLVIPFTPWPSLVACLFRDKLGTDRIFWNHRGGYDSAGFNYNRFLTHLVRLHAPTFMANTQVGARFLDDTGAFLAWGTNG